MSHVPVQNSKSKHLASQLNQALSAIFLIATASLAGAQTPAPAPEASLSYTVKPSDKLIRLSREMLVSPQAWNEVARYNQLKNPDVILAGQKLEIPLRYLKSTPAASKLISAAGDVTLGGQPAQPGAAIADGSQLKTGANSSAVIELGDGSRVKILPNSLTEVVTSRNYAMRDASASGSTHWFSGLMRLSAGALEALAAKATRRATPLQIATQTATVGVRGTEFRVGLEDGASQITRVEVLEGKVRADNAAQQSGADLPVATGALVKPLEKEVRVVPLLPAPDLSNISADVLKPLGSWPMPVLAGASALRVQVASDDKFDKIVRDFKVATGSADLASLANGNWFARVRGIDAQGLEGFDSVKLIAVKDGQWRVSSSSMRLVDGKTVLSWLGQQVGGQPMAAGSYSALVARDPALTQVVVNAQGQGLTPNGPNGPNGPSGPGGPSLALGELKPGVYFIRLRSQLAQSGNQPGFMDSEIYRFEISGNWGFSVFEQLSALQPVK